MYLVRKVLTKSLSLFFSRYARCERVDKDMVSKMGEFAVQFIRHTAFQMTLVNHLLKFCLKHFCFTELCNEISSFRRDRFLVSKIVLLAHSF